MSKLRVLASAFACAPGGASEQFGGGELILGWNVVNQLARFHDVWVLTHSFHRAAIEKALSIQRSAVPHFVYLSLPSWLEDVKSFQGGIQFYAYLWQLRAYFEARRLHGQIRFDVFHHVTYANDWMASFIGALLPVPYIRGPGGGANRTPAQFLGEYRFRDRLWERFRTLGQRVLRHDPLFILGQTRARAILVCNREALETVLPRWRRKAQLFPVNGVTSSDLCASDRTEKLSKSFEVLSTGKLLHWKGFGLAIRSFGMFAARHPDAHLTIVGDGPELRRLKALVSDLEIESRVRFEKWLPRDEVLSRMRTCDVFLYGSLRDGGGAVVVEAMAAGKPVICVDLGGPGMHVTEDCGIKVSPLSAEQVVCDLAAALERLHSDKGLRLRMGEAARKRAERIYHWDRLGERILEIYNNVLDNQGGKG
jgi:glycosyltransferase involved in cell wall biosynthesis